MKKLYKECWNLMSKCVRLRNADWRGYVSCYTCGEIKNYKEMDAGHLFHNRLDFDFRNIKPQCKICNQHKGGNHKIFLEKAKSEYGEEVIRDMKNTREIVYNDKDLKKLKQLLEEYLYLIEKKNE